MNTPNIRIFGCNILKLKRLSEVGRETNFYDVETKAVVETLATIYKLKICVRFLQKLYYKSSYKQT